MGGPYQGTRVEGSAALKTSTIWRCAVPHHSSSWVAAHGTTPGEVDLHRVAGGGQEVVHRPGETVGVTMARRPAPSK